MSQWIEIIYPQLSLGSIIIWINWVESQIEFQKLDNDFLIVFCIYPRPKLASYLKHFTKISWMVSKIISFLRLAILKYFLMSPDFLEDILISSGSINSLPEVATTETIPNVPNYQSDILKGSWDKNSLPKAGSTEAFPHISKCSWFSWNHKNEGKYYWRILFCWDTQK